MRTAFQIALLRVPRHVRTIRKVGLDCLDVGAPGAEFLHLFRTGILDVRPPDPEARKFLGLVKG